jgi:CheY-like chemotaxis protein
MNSPTASNSSASILIVEDEVLLCETLEQLLSFSGFKTLTAHNGKEALAVLEKNRVDLILSDIQMPVMGGIELLKNVKTKYPGVKLIFFSAFADLTRTQALDLGALELLPKPLRIENLVEKIHESLAS